MNDPSELFLDFIRPHWQRLHITARHYVTRPSDAHDLVQEVLLRAWRNFAPSDERVYQKAWLFVIMRNVVKEWHRTARHRIRIVPTTDAELTEMALSDLTDPFCPLPNMDERRFREFLDDRLAEALDRLTDPMREVVILSVAGGLNYREIAELLDCPLGTVMSRMVRARRMLRERLADLSQDRASKRNLKSNEVQP